jgi:hypothetical protein
VLLAYVAKILFFRGVALWRETTETDVWDASCPGKDEKVSLCQGTSSIILGRGLLTGGIFEKISITDASISSTLISPTTAMA